MSQQQRKKIVYVFGSLRLGGTERQVVDTATRLNQQLFEPKLFCLSGGGELQTIVEQYGIETTIFPGHKQPSGQKEKISFRRSQKFLALYHYLKRERPDIVHCYLYTPSIYGGIAARLTRVPVLITNRRSLGNFKDTEPSYYQLLENVVNKVTDKILVNSLAVKHDVLQREAIAPKKIDIIYNGVDIHRYTPTDGKMELKRLKKQEWGISDTAPVIGIIANLIPYKGYPEFILAASEICHHYPETRFLCVGEDRGIQTSLEQLIRDRGLQRHVIFTGKVANVAEVLPAIDIQVSASYEEGFSNAILEGMAAGKPVIATSVGGTPEAVEHDITGLLVPPKNPAKLAQAILSLLSNPELAREFGHNGRKRAEEYFSLQKMIHSLETLYLKLMQLKFRP